MTYEKTCKYYFSDFYLFRGPVRAAIPFCQQLYQPEKPRRCDYIGLKALKILKAMKPDVQIYLYGSSMPATFEFECKNLNIIPIKECNELYNK